MYAAAAAGNRDLHASSPPGIGHLDTTPHFDKSGIM